MCLCFYSIVPFQCELLSLAAVGSQLKTIVSLRIIDELALIVSVRLVGMTFLAFKWLFAVAKSFKKV